MCALPNRPQTSGTRYWKDSTHSALEPMVFKDVVQGHHRIYVGCMELGSYPGFTAALIVCRISTGAAAREVFRDVALCGGHRWATSAQALDLAIDRGRQLVRDLAADPS